MLMNNSHSVLMTLLVLVVVVVIVTVVSSKAISSVEDDLIALKNSIPMAIIPKELNEIINVQTSMINLIKSYTDHYDSIENSLINNENGIDSSRYYTDSGGMNNYRSTNFYSNPYAYSHNDNLNQMVINIDVIFIGFPSTALEVVGERWFESLSRHEHIMSSINHEIMQAPGSMDIKYNYHLIKSSFHVGDVVKAQMAKLMRTNDDSYSTKINSSSSGSSSDGNDIASINVWEMEEVISSLSSAVSSAGLYSILNEDDTHIAVSSSSIYILNIDFDQKKYRYRNGFSLSDYQYLNNNTDINHICQQLLKEERRTSRVQLPAVNNANIDTLDTINRHGNVDNSYDGDSRGSRGSTSSRNIRWKDAVKVTRSWAETLRTQSSSMNFSIVERAKRILTVSDSSLYKYRIELARSILTSTKPAVKTVEKDNESTAEPSCSTVIWVGNEPLMWIDINTIQSPPSMAASGSAINTPAPRKLNNTEWLKIGASKASIDDVASYITKSKSMLKRYADSVTSLMSQIPCPADSHIKTSSRGSVSKDELFNELAGALKESIVKGKSSSSCALLQLQSYLFDLMSDMSASLEGMQDTLDVNKIGDFIELKEDFALYYSEILMTTLETVNTMYDTSFLHKYHLSAEATMYLAYLASSITRMTRYFVQPPMQLRIDPLHMSTQHILNSTVGARSISHTEEHFYSRHRHEFNLWSALLPAPLTPAKVDISIYVIKLQQSYPPILPANDYTYTGFDYLTYVKEATQLKLQNQEFIISLHEVDASSERSLAFGLTLCMKSAAMAKGFDDDVHSFETHTYNTYLDTTCIWSYLQHHDEAASKDTVKDSSTMHIPVFMVSFDSDRPVYLDAAGSVSETVGNTIITVQNKHMRLQTAMRCGDTKLYINGRNPMSQSLASLGALIGGLSLSSQGHCGLATVYSLQSILSPYSSASYRQYKHHLNEDTRIKIDELSDWSSYSGNSPAFYATMTGDVTHFSAYDIAFIHRSKVLRSVTLVSEFVALIEDEYGHHYDSEIDALIAMVNRAIAHMNKSDWPNAAAYANYAYMLLIECSDKIKIAAATGTTAVGTTATGTTADRDAIPTAIGDDTYSASVIIYYLLNFVLFPAIVLGVTAYASSVVATKVSFAAAIARVTRILTSSRTSTSSLP